MSKPNQQKGQQVKPADKSTTAPTAPAEPVQGTDEQDKQTPTTMKIKPDTKSRLEGFKEIFNLTDLDAVVNRLIDIVPKKLMSTEETVHLVMTRSKYRWLVAKQNSCDCRTCLDESKV